MIKTNQRRRSQLLARCIPMLRAHVRRLVRDRQSARDILQEVMLTILSDPSCPEDTAQFAEFCREVTYRLTVPEALEPNNLSAEMLSEDDWPELPDPLLDPERTADTREELERGLKRLNDDALRLLVRRYVLEENANEIARELAQSPAALRVRLMRLRSAARSAMR